MQTFLPYANVHESMKCLDYRRLGKQRVEAYQIINILTGKTTKAGWRNHPAVLMWKGYENALMFYFDVCVDEWVRRGYKNNMQQYGMTAAYFPWWFGNVTFHSSHRSNLLRKDPVFYGKYGWVERHDLPYYWPSHYVAIAQPVEARVLEARQ